MISGAGLTVIMSIVQLILSKVLFARKEPESPWFDGMFQLVQKLFCLLQAVVLSCGGEKVSPVPLVGVVADIIIKCMFHWGRSDVHLPGQGPNSLVRVLPRLLQFVDEIR